MRSLRIPAAAGLGIALSLGCLAGCGDDDATPVDAGPFDAAALDAGPPDAAPTDAGTDGGPMYDAGPYVRVPEATASAGRASCAFGAGAMPWQTVGEEYPIGNDIPIKHFILMMQENRSFDHYFGQMAGVDGHPAGASNPDPGGTAVPAYHESTYCVDDLDHSWNGSHRQYNGGAMDGFVVTNEPGGSRTMGYFDQTDLTFYYSLYQTFAMSDRHFCSLLGPTWPNRFFFASGTSFGQTSNMTPDPARLPTDRPYVVMQQLDRAGVPWRIYNASVAFAYGGYPAYIARARGSIRTMDRFFVDVASGEIADVVFLDAEFVGGGDETDEHPPADPQAGERFVESVVRAVMASPIWHETAIILTYDEHGGFYDHVAPPEACPPGDFPPNLGPGDAPGAFDRLGFRVPLAVISPYAKAHYVSHQVTDLTSVLRLVQTRYLLPAMTGRDANAWPLLDMFDFAAPPFATPPSLDAATVDEAKLEACRVRYPSSI